MALINLSSLGLVPPLITLNGCDVDTIIKMIESKGLSRSEKNVLSAIKTVSRESETKYINIAALSLYMNKSSGSIRKTLKDLVTAGVFKEEYCQAHPTIVRRSSLFSFVEQSTLCLPPEADEQLALELEKKKILGSISMNEEDPYGRADDLICKYLFVALEYKHKATSKESHSLAYINKEPINVVAKTDGETIAKIKDLRYYLSVLKNCETQMQLRTKAVEVGALSSEELKSTIFDLHEIDILSSAGLGSGSGEREGLKRAMERLDGTSYYIDNPSVEIMNIYGMKERRVKVQHFSINDYAKNNAGRRFYRVEIPQRIVDGMLISVRSGVEVFKKIDPRLFKETSSLTLALSLWASHLKPGRTYKLHWQDLKDFIHPKLPMLVFKEDFINVIKKNLVNFIYDEDGKEKRNTDGELLSPIIYKPNTDGEIEYSLSEIHGLKIEYNNLNDVGEFVVRKDANLEQIRALIKSSELGITKGSRRKKLAPPLIGEKKEG